MGAGEMAWCLAWFIVVFSTSGVVTSIEYFCTVNVCGMKKMNDECSIFELLLVS